MTENGEKSNTNNNPPTNVEIEENTGFAIVVNGHSLVHCLTPELEEK